MSVRVRFAPSPTGPLHIGGVRTALYNYLFAKQREGIFILRIEDTDQVRYVDGAEGYIMDALNWLDIRCDEGPGVGGDFGPYRQSERRDLYNRYVDQLTTSGHAYYAFDTPEELEAMRSKLESEGQHAPKYDHKVRLEMKNSLTMSDEEVQTQLKSGEKYTIRLKIDPGSDIVFNDVVRGEVRFNTSELDDKIIMKSDGWPTYHLANVVDDYLMKISHVIRGEEWLSSTPHHVYLYRAFGWEDVMPEFVHLPLILKPTGKGKLSKRDGAKFGFPVFPLDWKGDEPFEGFREKGFLGAAVLNFLALLGWHPSDDREMFSKDELVKTFSLERITKSGARFDYDKAKWFNQQYLLSMAADDLAQIIKEDVEKKFERKVDIHWLAKVVEHMVPRVELLPEILESGHFFFERPSAYDEKTIRKRFKGDIEQHWQQLSHRLGQIEDFESQGIEGAIKSYMESNELGFGALFPLLRIALSGTLKGPDLFAIFELLGKDESLHRMTSALERFKHITS